jgi:hypothetical protein
MVSGANRRDQTVAFDEPSQMANGYLMKTQEKSVSHQQALFY